MILSFMGNNSCFAQDNTALGSWGMLILKGRINNKFTLQGEFNTRSDNFASNFNYCEYKTSVIYSLSSKFGMALGAGGYNKNDDGSFFTTTNSEKEFRTWGDLLFKHALNRLFFDHRARLEQRFLHSDYQNRLRYRFALTVPVNGKVLTDKTFYLASYDELFFGESTPVYEKNKFYAGAGYKFNKTLAVQLGGISQADYKNDNDARKNYLQLIILCNIN